VTIIIVWFTWCRPARALTLTGYPDQKLKGKSGGCGRVVNAVIIVRSVVEMQTVRYGRYWFG
jgi:hypothetical protein